MRTLAAHAPPLARRTSTLALVALAGAAALVASRSSAAEEPVVIPPPAADLQEEGLATAVFAGGCFWGVQGVFQHVRGVTEAVSGYAGGAADTATYDVVSTGSTGHAEAVQVTYDPAVVSYGDLLQVFFSVAHNPTQLDYQGPDHGTQYRSAVFAEDDAEADVAAAYIAQLDATGAFGDPLVTAVEPLAAFYPAEDYHQDYLTLNPSSGYIQVNDLPKVEALEALFPALWSSEPVLVGS